MADESVIGVETEEEETYSTGWTIVVYLKALINFAAFCVCFFFVLTLLGNKKARSNSYNVYIIFLLIPDGTQTFFRASTNLIVAMNQGVRWFPPYYFYFDMFFFFQYYYCNVWLNAVVAREIFGLLKRSYNGERSPPPTLPRVYKQVAGVYIFSTCLTLWTILPLPYSLLDVTDHRRGKAENGGSHGDGFNSLTAAIIALCLVFIPISYVVYIRTRIAVKKLLPRRGRTRILSVFFMRVMIVFILFYIPTIIISFLKQLLWATGTPAAFWVDTIVGISTAAQALTTIYMVYLKEDIGKAIDEAFNLTFGRCCGGCMCNSKRHLDANTSEMMMSVVHVSGLRLTADSNVDDTDARSRSRKTAMQFSERRLHVESSLESRKSEWEEDDDYGSNRSRDIEQDTDDSALPSNRSDDDHCITNASESSSTQVA